MTDEKRRIGIRVGDTEWTAELEDNSSAEALWGMVSEKPLTVRMDDYGGMEKVGDIGTSLPRNDRDTRTGPGDIILYLGTNIVIYYDRNHWNFTRLGRILDVTESELRRVLGKGGVTVTFTAF